MRTKRERLSIWLLFTVSILWVYTVDATRLIKLGSFTASGVLTLATAALAVVAVIAGALTPRRAARDSFGGVQLPRVTWVLLLAVTTMIAVRLAGNLSTEGLQNVAVYLSFFATIFAVGVGATQRWRPRVARAYHVATLGVPTIYLVSTFAGWQLYGERSYAIVAVVLLAFSTTVRSGKLIDRIAPFLLVLTIAMSESRTALAVAIGLLLFLTTRTRRSLRMLVAGGVTVVAAGLSYWIITEYEPIRARFSGGDNAVVGGTQINTSGRQAFWEATWRSALEKPTWGHGPGSAAELITSIWPSVGHPHNDYLRLLHDFGIFGLALFLGAGLALGVSLVGYARRFDRAEHWTAIAALCALSVLAITDNVLAYPFAMVPAAILIGTSFASARLEGSPAPEPEPTTERRREPRHSSYRRSTAR